MASPALSMRTTASAAAPSTVRSVPMSRPSTVIAVPDAGQGGGAGDDHQAAPGRRAMLHPRHHLLSDITALLEFNPPFRSIIKSCGKKSVASPSSPPPEMPCAIRSAVLG
jgi:hypothetical protein